MGKDALRWRKRDIVQILNHGFDGTARRSGKSEAKLFAEVMARLQSVGATNEEVQAALHTARTAHSRLLDKGRLSADQADRANAAVDEFEHRFRSRR